MGKETREIGSQGAVGTGDFPVRYVVMPLRGTEQPVVDSEVSFSELSAERKYRAWIEEANGTRHSLHRGNEKVDKSRIEEARAALLRGESMTPAVVYVLLENSAGRRH